MLSLGVLYTPAVLVVAVFFGAVYASAVAVAAMLVFNFLFLPPVNTLTLADARNWTALAVYVVTAIVCSNLATSARRRAAEAEQREREAALLADASAAVLREEPLDEIRERADQVLAGELAHARFEAGVQSLLALAEERRARGRHTTLRRVEDRHPPHGLPRFPDTDRDHPRRGRRPASSASFRCPRRIARSCSTRSRSR